MQDQLHKMEELMAETERLRQRVAQLEKNEVHLRVTLNSIGDAVISTDLEGKIIQMNPVAQKLTGWNLNDAMGKPLSQIFQIINAQTRQHIENPVAEVLECGKTVGLANHTILQSADGREYQIADSAAPIRDENNRVWGVVMVFRDVTEEYTNREEIRLKEEALNTFLENSLMAVSMTNEEGMVEIWNHSSEVLTGLSKKEVIGKPFYELLLSLTSAEKQNEQQKTIYKTLMERGLKTGKTSFSGIKEINFRHPDGHQVTSRQILIPIKTQKGFRFGTIADDITGILVAKKQILDSEERFRTLTENIPGVVYLCRNDEKYSMLYLNNAVEAVTGYTVEDFLENRVNFVELYHPEDSAGIFRTVNNALDKKEPYHLIYRLRNKDGLYHWIEEWGTGVWDGNNLRFLEGFIADITNSKQAEEELKESQDRFKRLVEHSPDIIYSFSTVRGGSYHSSRVYDILGFTPQQLKDDPKLWENSIHPDDLKMVLEAVANAAHGRPINIEYRIRSASGEWRWLHDRSMHLYDHKGDTLIEGMASDITDRKLAEEKLLQSEQNYKGLQELFRNLADIMPDMLWAKDMNRNFIFVNNSVCKNLLNAKDTNEPIGKSDLFFALRERNAHPENPEWYTFGELCRDSDEIVMQSGETERFDEFGNINGKFLFLDVIKTPLRNENGEMIGVVGTARDVTENRKAEQKLRESEANLKAIIENSLENIWSVDSNYKIQYINAVFARSFEETFGTKLQVGMNVVETLPEPLKSIWKERYDRALEGEQFDLQDKIDVGETSVYIYVAMNPIVVDNTIVGVSVFGRDITERVLAEEKLIKAKEKAEQSDHLKLAFINNISHEIRTPLNGILGFGQVLAEPGLSENERQDYYQILQESSNRLMQTVTDFIDISMLVSGTLEVTKSKVYLNPLMGTMLEKAMNLCSKKALSVEPEIPENSNEKVIFTDGELLRKALGHLLDNAAKFTTNGSIRFGYNYGQDEITFFVSDTGSGIPSDKLNNIFDVFTQGDTSITRGYEGSGLGLSITKGIVNLLGGKIRVESKVKKGTTIFFTLPNITVEVKTVGFQPPLIHSVISGKPLILIAEDDEPNYFYIKMVLEKSGYATIRASNGQEVVNLCSTNPEINLVLMDIKMPVMNGIEATKAIREFDTDLPIIAITAYAQSGDENHIKSAGCTDYLSKPVKREELLKMLSVLLPVNLE